MANTYHHIDNCPLCESNNFALALEVRDLYSTNEIFKIMSCQQCGFLFTQDFPDENTIDRYYEGINYISHSDSQKGITHKLYHLVRKFMLGRKAKLVTNNVSTTSRWLLDVGCGTGYFLAYMHRKNWLVKGIEKNEKAREFSHHQLGIMTDKSEAFFHYEENQFGIITLWHSLEHLQKLNETMAQLHKILITNGTLVIALPNAQSSDAMYYKEYWAAYDVPRHLWHFTPSTLNMLAKKHHFIIEKVYPMPLDAFYISILSEKYKKNLFSFVKGIMKGIHCYFSTLPEPTKSSSLVFILKKTDYYGK